MKDPTYRFGDFANAFPMRMKLPSHFTGEFDEERFLRGLRLCTSIDKEYKRTILLTIPTLSKEQVNALIDIFENEISQFRGLPLVERLLERELIAITQWLVLESELPFGGRDGGIINQE